MGKVSVITGKKFGHLTVLRATEERNRRSVVWECVCECGKAVLMPGRVLTDPRHKPNCGCFKYEGTITHGASRGKKRTVAYKSWCQAKERCFNTNNPDYGYYGGRGITMCERWRNSFANFVADMGEPSAGLTLDRFPNNDGNYEPGNCRWATRLEQSHNRRKRRPKAA